MMMRTRTAIVWKSVGALATTAVLGWTGLSYLGLIAYEKVSFDRNFSSEAITTLDIASDAGSVTIVADRVSGVQLVARGHSGLFKNVHSEIIEGETLKIRSKCSGVSITRCDLNYTLHVPSSFVVNGVTNNGKTTVDGLTSNVNLRSDNGSIEVRNSTGALQLSSNNGTIRVVDSRSTYVHARTDNGSIRASFLSAPDVVDIESSNGGLTVEVPDTGEKYRTDTDTDNGKIVASVPVDSTSERLLKARTDNGGITLRHAMSPIPAPPSTAGTQ
jgi:hypothetical protein